MILLISMNAFFRNSKHGRWRFHFIVFCSSPEFNAQSISHDSV